MKNLLKPILLTVMLTTLLGACATKQELTESEAADNVSYLGQPLSFTE